MHFIIVPLIAAALYFTKSGNTQSTDTTNGIPVHRDNPWSLPDIDSSEQKGVYARDYDDAFEKASHATRVPFALIKAHAIRESSLNPGAYHYDNERSGASYGLMQVEWNKNNRFDKYGYPDSELGRDGSKLYDSEISAMLGAYIIRDNLNWLKGNIRDTINAYNTGSTELNRPAPNNYTDDVIGYYQTLIGGPLNA